MCFGKCWVKPNSEYNEKFKRAESIILFLWVRGMGLDVLIKKKNVSSQSLLALNHMTDEWRSQDGNVCPWLPIPHSIHYTVQCFLLEGSSTPQLDILASQTYNISGNIRTLLRYYKQSPLTRQSDPKPNWNTLNKNKPTNENKWTKPLTTLP